MRVIFLALALGTLCTLATACQGARLRAANQAFASVTPPPTVVPRAGTRRGMATDSRAGRLARPLITREAEAGGAPYRPPVTDAMLDEVERAVRLRKRARQRVRPAPCGALKRARAIPPPDKNGDSFRGGADLGRLFSGVKRIVNGKRRP